MSKAEERAQAAYPAWRNGIGDEFSSNSAYYGFIEGYHQAEKDLELSWEDIKEICDIAFEEACRLQRNMKGSLIYKKEHYQIVLKRFKERKEHDRH